MKLFFYSGGTRKLNHNLNLELIKLLSLSSRITYIPSSSDIKRKNFDKFREWFGFYGYKNFLYFDLDKEFDKRMISEVEKSEAVYLSGGNTFHFIHLIRKRKFSRVLRDFVSCGKVLIGLSAGSMIMTPTIRVSVDYHNHLGDFDELNVDEIKSYKGLSLVDFEFLPHFNLKPKRNFAENYLKRRGRDIYTCCDGSGIIVEGKKLKLIGEVEKIC
ncbi:Type 1 glutamine amidotransferase-like domain-containing protein [Candidatus Dojkabacteria bacterium]|nr:Type 1 glutamine amidotransferase-like domain-containing protein [Candidatus Dojkabacteria bacterium]